MGRAWVECLRFRANAEVWGSPSSKPSHDHSKITNKTKNLSF